MLRRLWDSPAPWFLLSGLLLLAALASLVDVRLPSRPRGGVADVAALARTRPLSVVFVLIDTLRADRLSAYGYARPTSPGLERLAADGVRFLRVEAPSSWTKCSMASLWTAQAPPRTGVTRFAHALPAAARSAAEVFREAGYTTAGIVRNGWVAANFGFDQGFETYVRPAGRARAGVAAARPGAHLVGSDEDVTRAALSFLESQGEEPFLLYLHYMDVHQYAFDDEAADQGFGASYSDAYDAAIHWVDRNVARVVAELERRRLLAHTVVVVTSDHGEGFREHGLEGHARTLYAEVTAVPWILALPRRLEGAVVVPGLARSVDVWPTLLDLLGLPALPDVDGRSLLPEILAAERGAAPDAEPPAAVAYLDRSWGRIGEPSRPLVSVREPDGATLVAAFAEAPGAREEGERRVAAELYDAATDPREQRDLAAARPELLARLLARARAAASREPAWGEAPEVEVDALHREQLRALGYVVR